MSRVPPIVGPDGRPYYVVAREPIGAEHLNAATAWAQRQHAASLREHGRDAAHNMPYHCIAALRIRMPIWDQNHELWRAGEIRGDSQFFAYPDGDARFGGLGRQYTVDEWEEQFGAPPFDFDAPGNVGEARISAASGAAHAVGYLFDWPEVVVQNNAIPAFLGGNRGVFYLRAAADGVQLHLTTHILGSVNAPVWYRTAGNRDFLVSLFLMR